MSPLQAPLIREITSYGQYGVDLFFVLSGWLIGQLYWREYIRNGNVVLIRFWARRWLRTIPPYAVALMFYFFGVHLTRGERFDWGYLIFIQNYYVEMPFFLVSWSLCIEEHFYLVAPIWFGLVSRFHRIGGLFHLVILAPAMFRYLHFPMLGHEFGHGITATHFRFDGLYVGFALAGASAYKMPFYALLVRRWPYFVAGSLLLLFAISRTSDRTQHATLYSIIAIFFAAVLVGMQQISISAYLRPALRTIALGSFSIYLMHPIGIHISRLFCDRMSFDSTLAYFVATILSSTCLSTIMYVGVERTSIRLREALMKDHTTTSIKTAPRELC